MAWIQTPINPQLTPKGQKPPKPNPIAEINFIRIAQNYKLSELKLFHNIYHYLIRLIAWKFHRNFYCVNIAKVNSILLLGEIDYLEYDPIKDYIAPFQYLERIFLQYKSDEVPVYLWDTKAFPNLHLFVRSLDNQYSPFGSEDAVKETVDSVQWPMGLDHI